jgi:hypothetical protein
MMRTIPLILFALAGCASNSGIVPAGQGTYNITAQAATGFGGLGDLKADALRQAAAHCGTKDLQVVRYDETKPPYAFGNYPRVDLTFRCADK